MLVREKQKPGRHRSAASSLPSIEKQRRRADDRCRAVSLEQRRLIHVPASGENEGRRDVPHQPCFFVARVADVDVFPESPKSSVADSVEATTKQ